MHFISKYRHIGDFRLNDAKKYEQTDPVTDHSVIDGWSLRVDEEYNFWLSGDHNDYITVKHCTSEIVWWLLGSSSI